ncbi:hypothetical protein LOB55_08730 [Lactobacillus delbrueckii subsp. lactis]|jgi:hypothetical protein|uniref:Uncharacterized protein n=2 Tax=Lactobacillus delbrueckii TaxID=1584 RepID=A0ABD4W1J3_9LACO|nr:hypothetical protein [Lactobacillus delbrueckii]MCD5438997.1 hypothetical protein [Lactobacillus delbrueckii subsp. lactis]MCD5469514.1 hypothetical protein [Lactobacillus delbrueckii subsp. lactis]MCZ0796742.1 hypothetical protein [Lactobacillus delbrueckii subsp. lactis]MDA3777478.1 hypothetical protein [Lactobacillus delbrueckii]MDA3782334.1 hypothetical protein [Lactobacillus delbrueckii]
MRARKSILAISLNMLLIVATCLLIDKLAHRQSTFLGILPFLAFYGAYEFQMSESVPKKIHTIVNVVLGVAALAIAGVLIYISFHG